VGLCVIASILVASSEYLGNPIICQNSAGQIADGVFNAFCWIHGGKKFQSYWLMSSSATHTSMKNLRPMIHFTTNG
jgi:hypothetical protein